MGDPLLIAMSKRKTQIILLWGRANSDRSRPRSFRDGKGLRKVSEQASDLKTTRRQRISQFSQSCRDVVAGWPLRPWMQRARGQIAQGALCSKKLRRWLPLPLPEAAMRWRFTGHALTATL